MSVLTDAALAVLLGGLFAVGVLCMLAALPRWRAVSLTTRIAPYVRDVVADADLPVGILPSAGVLPSRARGIGERVRGLIGGAAGGEALARRLAQADSARDAVSFRARQLVWGLVGLGTGAVLAIAGALSGRATASAVVLPVILAVSAALAPDLLLTWRVKARMTRVAEELPTTLEFLALCLSAGESLLDALRRVAAVGSGELTAELHAVVIAVRTGSPLADALAELTRKLQFAELGRAVDQVVAALEHGAPLAGVLHAQAGDAREESKRVLIEQAGRREILMLLPVVFLILPLSVLFAVFPGVFILRLGIG